MKIVVIGGTGLIGSKLVTKLREHGHEAVRGVAGLGRQHAHRRGSGRSPRGRLGGRRRVELPLLRGRGGAEVLRDVDPQPPRRGGGRRRGPSRRAVGRGNRASARERLLPREDRSGEADQGARRSRTRSSTRRSSSSSSRASPTPPPTATRCASPPVLIQPMAADDVASAVGRVAVGRAVNGTVEVAGPEQFRLDELIRRGLEAQERSARGGRRSARALLRRRAGRAHPVPGRRARSARPVSRTG